jgi:hypothetical protein
MYGLTGVHDNRPLRDRDGTLGREAPKPALEGSGLSRNGLGSKHVLIQTFKNVNGERIGLGRGPDTYFFQSQGAFLQKLRSHHTSVPTNSSDTSISKNVATMLRYRDSKCSTLMK